MNSNNLYSVADFKYSMVTTLRIIQWRAHRARHFSTKWTRNSGNGQTTGPGITDRMTNLRCPLANRTTCTQGLPPTLSDGNWFLPTGPDSTRAAMQARRLGRMGPGGQKSRFFWFNSPDCLAGEKSYKQETLSFLLVWFSFLLVWFFFLKRMIFFHLIKLQ